MVEESIPRTIQCLEMLEDEDVWFRPNEVSNSVGNLVLHVIGNARQWILSGLGGIPDTRDRDWEFAPDTRVATPELITMLQTLETELTEAIQAITAKQLVNSYGVQGFDETGIGILVHAAEHFSYHVGQITYFVKARKGASTGYYDGLEL